MNNEATMADFKSLGKLFNHIVPDFLISKIENSYTYLIGLLQGLS